MIIENDYFKITIEQESKSNINLFNSGSHVVVINPFKYDSFILGRTRLVIENKECDSVSKVLVCSPYSIMENCAILNGRELAILFSREIFIINIDECRLLKCKSLEGIGDNFSIHLVSDGYIIHGEIEILKLDYELNKIWTFFGSDIFVRQDSEPSFLLDTDKIKLYDWNNAYYEIDLNGKLIYDSYK